MITLSAISSSKFATQLAFADNPAGQQFVARARAKGLLADCVSNWADWVEGAQPDLLHVHAGIGWEGQQIVAAGRRLDIPVVRTEHLPWLITDGAQQSAYMANLAGTTDLICVSAASAESWRRALAYWPRGLAVHHIANGILAQAADKSRSECRAALGIAPDAPLVLHVGRFAPQ